jgi:hypothetical protein
LKTVGKGKEKEKEPISRAELLSALRILSSLDVIVLFGEDKQKPLFKYHRDTEF